MEIDSPDLEGKLYIYIYIYKTLSMSGSITNDFYFLLYSLYFLQACIS